MMRFCLVASLVATLAAWPVASAEVQAASAPAPALAPAPKALAKFILVGDSTTAAHGGWGPSFCGERLNGAAVCINLARAGRSSSSYRAEGLWALALSEMATPGFAPTFVLIQFGHNDQPGKPGRSTDLATEFPANLERFIVEARATGATPILVTPLTRRGFKNGRLADTLEPWAQAARAVGARLNAPVVDLHATSTQAVEALGPVEAAKFAKAPPLDASALMSVRADARTEPAGPAQSGFDNTHLGPVGATFFARQVAAGLAAASSEAAAYLAPLP